MVQPAALVARRRERWSVADGRVGSGFGRYGTAGVYEVRSSGTFNLPPGLKKYRLEYGGEVGGVYVFHGGDVHPVSS